MNVKNIGIIFFSFSFLFASAVFCADSNVKKVLSQKTVIVSKQKLQGSCLKKTFKVAGKTLQDVKPKNEYFSTTLKLLPLAFFNPFLRSCVGLEDDFPYVALSFAAGCVGLLGIGCVSAQILAVRFYKKFKKSWTFLQKV